ncbi:MAG TPA: hypothetical protein VFQ39_18415, partial [Longimicrobium sp.]|nr:hypothetical protein [Longimicrobium sp.]
ILARGRPWAEILFHFRSNPWALGMAELVESIATSRYADGLFATTSMHTLLLAQSPEIDMVADVLRVEPTHDGKVRFEYVERMGARRRWVREVPPEAAFATFEGFLRHLRWFVEYRPS